MHRRCASAALYIALVLLVATASFVAYGQDELVPAPVSDPTLLGVAWLVKVGGLPAVSGWVGYLFSKALTNWRPTLRIELPADVRVVVVDPSSALRSGDRHRVVPVVHDVDTLQGG